MEFGHTVKPFVDLSTLPNVSEPARDFRDTSFFRCDTGPSPQLPTPRTVLRHSTDPASGVVKFEHLNLAVKFGPTYLVRLEEAQSMQAIKAAFADDEVPVPEVFGWRKHDNKHFIYMSLIRGKTLREAWGSLTTAEKESISIGLSRIVVSLRQMTSTAPAHLIGKEPSFAVRGISNESLGSVTGSGLQDRFFTDGYDKPSFSSIKAFNDWLLAAATRQSPQSDLIIDPFRDYRDCFPDTGNICFTHGDLTIGNIIVDGPLGSREIVGIIDWEQAGWYPEYWEYCKLLYGVACTHEWRKDGWADKVMAPFEEEFLAFAEYSSWRCP